MARLRVRKGALERLMIQRREDTKVHPAQRQIRPLPRKSSATGVKEAGEILLKQPGMEELDAILRQRGFKPTSFDDWRNESSSDNVAVLYRGDVDKLWV